MTPQPDSPHTVRKVVLPSGKTIEIVYFSEPDSVEARRDLSLCPSCSCDLVFPTDWEEAGEAHWELTLRCPNCEWTDGGVFEHAVVEQWDERLDDGTQALVRDLRQLAHANMEDEVERFVGALHGDHVLPMDF